MHPPQPIPTRAAEHRPIRIGIVAEDKLNATFLNQIQREPRLHLLGIADADPQRAASSLRLAGWPDEVFAAASFDSAFKHGNTCITDDADALITNPYIDVIIALRAVETNDVRHHDHQPKRLIAIDANTNFDPTHFTRLLSSLGL